MKALFRFGVATLALATAVEASAQTVIGAPGDPKTISAKAEHITATAAKHKAETERLIGVANAELSRAKAAHHWALVRYLEDQRRILQDEYQRILSETARFRREIEALEWKRGQLGHLRLGMVTSTTLEALNTFIASAEDVEPIFAVMDKEVGSLPADSFKPEPGRGGTVRAFSGGNVWELLLFAQENRLWLVEMKRAHLAVSRALGTVTKLVVGQIFSREQAIQAARASRLSEVFAHPPTPE